MIKPKYKIGEIVIVEHYSDAPRYFQTQILEAVHDPCGDNYETWMYKIKGMYNGKTYLVAEADIINM